MGTIVAAGTDISPASSHDVPLRSSPEPKGIKTRGFGVGADSSPDVRTDDVSPGLSNTAFILRKAVIVGLLAVLVYDALGLVEAHLARRAGRI